MAEKKRMTVKQIKQLLERQVAKEIRDIELKGSQQLGLQGLVELEHAQARLDYCEYLLDVINGKKGR